MDVSEWPPKKIASGGQTGVDRAGLDWALQNGIAHGGWCPKGRLAADGPLPPRYCLRETESSGYRQRTKLNVQDSDATLVVNIGELSGGTLQTVRFAQALKKPHYIFQLEKANLAEIEKLITWWISLHAESLNIAGPGETKCPGIYLATLSMLASCEAMGGRHSAIPLHSEIHQ